VEAVEYFLLPLPAPLKSVVLPSSLSLSHSWDFLLPHPAPDKVGRFRVRFRFQLILLKLFRFIQNFTASASSIF